MLLRVTDARTQMTWACTVDDRFGVTEPACAAFLAEFAGRVAPDADDETFTVQLEREFSRWFGCQARASREPQNGSSYSVNIAPLHPASSDDEISASRPQGRLTQ